jgi:OST3 / OST6 family, transporter family
MVNLLLITLLLSVFINNTVDGARRTKAKESQAKSSSSSDARLQILSTKFLKQNLVPLTDSNYSKFVIQRPRDYVAVVMFTALGSRYSCTACKTALAIYVDVANLYYEQYNFNSSLPKDRLAFFIVDADTAGQTFEDMKLETVPRFYILPPRTESDSKLKLSDFEIENRYCTVFDSFLLCTTF